MTSNAATISRLHRALAQISVTPARLIASPPVAPGSGPARRASVAIIIRLRPEHSPASSTAPSSPPTSPNLNSSPPGPPPSLLATSPAPNPTPSPTPVPSGNKVETVLNQLEQFFNQPWVNHERTAIEVLYIKRASRATDKWSGHVAFPGGRSEPDDESAEFTAMRETWEEVGLDLAERDWISVGQLDDREITSSLGKRLLMILSPFVFLHTSPHAPIPELQETEVASAHWIPLELLHSPTARYGAVEIDIATRLAPKNQVARNLLKLLLGQMSFKCILLPNDPISSQLGVSPPPVGDKLPDLRLWGLTLGMTLDLLSHMTLSSLRTTATTTSPADLSTYPYAVSTLDKPPLEDSTTSSSSQPEKGRENNTDMKAGGGLNPFASSSEASIFPRFSYPDINFLIYLFGWRYRRLLRRQTTSSSNPPLLRHQSSSSSTRLTPTSGVVVPTYRVNWAGMSLNAYYAAVRRALVVAVLLRAVTAVGTVVGVGWYVREWWKNKRKSRVVV